MMPIRTRSRRPGFFSQCYRKPMVTYINRRSDMTRFNVSKDHFGYHRSIS